jgi:hypothetical protein
VAYLGNITKSKHWVPVVFDHGSAVVRYTDSMGDPITPKLCAAFIWWLHQHRAATSSPPIIEELPITQQQDNHSCGILTLNSLCHFFDPCKYQLVGGLRASVASECLKLFNEVASHIITRVHTFLFLTSSMP